MDGSKNKARRTSSEYLYLPLEESFCFSFGVCPESLAGTNFNTVPFMQYLLSVGVSNPSPVKTWPKCPSHTAHFTSVTVKLASDYPLVGGNHPGLSHVGETEEDERGAPASAIEGCVCGVCVWGPLWAQRTLRENSYTSQGVARSGQRFFSWEERSTHPER